MKHLGLTDAERRVLDARRRLRNCVAALFLLALAAGFLLDLTRMTP